MAEQPLVRHLGAPNRRGLLAFLTIASLSSVAFAPAEAVNVWSTVSETSIAATGDRLIVPAEYATVRVDLPSLRAALQAAPLEGDGAWDAAIELSLPMPDGTTARFAVIESPIMEQGLQDEFPEIRTYLAQGIDDPTATARLDLVPVGFHGMIRGASGTVMIDPYQRGDVQNYLVYDRYHSRRDGSPTVPWSCEIDATEEQIRDAAAIGGNMAVALPNGDELRTYRLACAATGEYTQFHGGTVGDGQAAIVTAINRVTGIYERDTAVRMVLVANNSNVVYTNGATDPYTNNNGGAMLAQNQANLDSVIGSANYDIGHVFSTGGGGVAGLGVVCVGGQKARGVTGLPSPNGDGFYVDYVAHEMGHQYNAAHTFNGSSGSCSGGNRSAANAYEPGSGSTIMAYAGICGGQNIQNFSDDYFHVRSQDQIVIYTNSLNGSTCPNVTNTGNTPPSVEADQAVSFDEIPIGTPFMLTAVGADGDGDDLTYCWEQYNLGPAGHPNSPSGNAPIFRSFLPVDGPTRVFPKWTDIINGTHTLGELLPTYSRLLTFRVSVRDNRADGGGTNWDIMTFDADDTAGPFLVDSPNGGEVWSATGPQLVQWDVANTTNANVNCQTVDILLSIDGGFTYPTTLMTGTPNDGSQQVTLPDINETDCRIMVKAADNIFFDISDDDFEINTTVAVGDSPATGLAAGLRIIGNRPNPFNPTTHITFNVAIEGETMLRVYDSVGRLVAVLAEGVLDAGVHSRVWDGLDMDGRPVASGVYQAQLEGTNGEITSSRMVLLK